MKTASKVPPSPTESPRIEPKNKRHFPTSKSLDSFPEDLEETCSFQGGHMGLRQMLQVLVWEKFDDLKKASCLLYTSDAADEVY